MAEIDQDVTEPSSSNHIMGVQFYPGNLDSNFRRLMTAYELSDEPDVGQLISAFIIIVDGQAHETTVGDKKYKSALLLLALAASYGKDDFELSQANRELIACYFPTGMVVEAQTNPETEHTTIRQLLIGDQVEVVIKRPSQD